MIYPGVGVSPCIQSGEFSMLGVADLKLWLRSDLGITLNGADVSAWADQTANANNALQATAGLQMAYGSGGVQGLPYLTLTGSEAMYIVDNTTLQLAAVTIFLVASDVTDSGVHNSTWLMKGEVTPSLFNYRLGRPLAAETLEVGCHNKSEFGAVWTGGATADVVSVGLNATDAMTKHNGTQNTFSFAYDLRQSTHHLTIGARHTFPAIPGGTWDRFAVGKLYEIAIVGRFPLTTTETSLIEAYLTGRYQ